MPGCLHSTRFPIKPGHPDVAIAILIQISSSCSLFMSISFGDADCCCQLCSSRLHPTNILLFQYGIIYENLQNNKQNLHVFGKIIFSSYYRINVVVHDTHVGAKEETARFTFSRTAGEINVIEVLTPSKVHKHRSSLGKVAVTTALASFVSLICLNT